MPTKTTNRIMPTKSEDRVKRILELFRELRGKADRLDKVAELFHELHDEAWEQREQHFFNPEPDKREVAKKLPDEYVSCRYTDLLAEIKYYPDGNAPTEHNALWSIDDYDKKCYWFCSDKPVGYVTPDGEVVTFWHKDSDEVRELKIKAKVHPEFVKQNALERYVMSVAKKWATERYWIPEYRYTLEDNESEVTLCVLEAIRNGVDRSKITKMCFDHLDSFYRPMRDYKTTPKEEVCNNAERYMYAMLFTGDINTLNKHKNMQGEELPLPTVDDLGQFTNRELKQFEKIKVIFDRTRSRHPDASIETWKSAQCYALNVPTKTAILHIYGDKAVGKKKKRRCEVAYSRQANQVFNWLLEEVEIMRNEGAAGGLDKWVKVLERSQAISWCRKAYDLAKKYDLMDIEENSPQEKALLSLIVTNPFKVKERLEKVIADAEKKQNADLFGELNGTVIIEDDDSEVFAIAASDGLPF